MMTTSNEHNNAPAVPQGDTVEIIGMKGGKEHFLGTMAMPPRMKAREIAREQFGHFVDDDGSDAELCFGALEQLIDYMQKTAATPSPAHAQYKDSTPHLSVGESSFESWFGEYNPANKGSKQQARDAYAAGMGDPLVSPAPAQEPVDMVPRAALHEVERERDWYKTRAQTMHEHQNGQVWYWQGDGEDHPETLVNSLPVVIRADQLRELMGLSKRQFDLICQAIDKADTVTMDGDYMLDSDDCIRVVRVMQVLFDIAALRAKGGK